MDQADLSRLVQLGYHACHALDPEEHAEYKRLYALYQKSITETAPPIEEPEPLPPPPPPPVKPRDATRELDRMEIAKVMGIRTLTRRNQDPFL